GRAGAAAGPVPEGARTGQAAVARGRARRVPVGVGSAGRMGRGDARGRDGPLRPRPAARGGRVGAHLGRAGAPRPVRPGRRTGRALLDLVAAWTAESNGRAEVAAVHGDATAAIAALGPPRARMAPLPPADALAHMAWAAASGGAHGRRRGMASGRFATWWAVA